MNPEKSILQKLKNRAKVKGMPFQLVLQLFCQEEFLRRLAQSEFRDQLVLKGGLFIFAYSHFESRPTMDIDFLARNLSNNQEEMRKVVAEICKIDTENSFISFKINSVEAITELKEYHGVRLKLLAIIANTNTPFDVDIGIGDVIVPGVDVIEIPTQLDGFNPPYVTSYSIESTIAEKLEAMFDRMETTSRMKDYYDIYYLASHYDFEGSILKEAISQTFANRGTVCNMISLKRLSGIGNDVNMKNRWLAFTKKTLAVSLDFQIVIRLIVEFIEPLVQAIEEGKPMKMRWSKDDHCYFDVKMLKD